MFIAFQLDSIGISIYLFSHRLTQTGIDKIMKVSVRLRGPVANN